MDDNEIKNESNEAEDKKSVWWKPVVLVAALIVVFILARVFGIGDKLGEVRGWIEGLGHWGPAAFILLYAIATVAALPGSALTVAAGALFGSVVGVVVVSVASTLGASLAFLVGRYFARDAIANWLSAKETFQKLDRMTEEHGAIVVALTRLVPIFPFNLLNYGFGLTKVRFRTYVFWSWLCMLPGTVLFVVGADAVFSGISEGRVPWVLVGVVVVMFAMLTVIVRYARQRLSDKEEVKA